MHLTKPVLRTVYIITDNRDKPRPRDKVYVTLYPSGVIGFRPWRRKTEYVLPLQAAYRLAVRATLAEEVKGCQSRD